MDTSHENCINIFVCGDNIRKGAASNAVQIAHTNKLLQEVGMSIFLGSGVALITPFKAGQIDFEAFGRLIDFISQIKPTRL